MLSGGCPQVEQGWEDATLWAHTGRQALKATGFVASCSWGAVAGLLICTSLLLGNFLSLSPPLAVLGGPGRGWDPSDSLVLGMLTSERALAAGDWLFVLGMEPGAGTFPSSAQGSGFV